MDTSSLSDKLKDLLGRLDQPYAGGIYSLSSPCEREQDGTLKPPRPVAYPPSAGFESAIFQRFDAIAELMQVHKDLRQPTCTPKRAEGTPVTVTFQEVVE